LIEFHANQQENSAAFRANGIDLTFSERALASEIDRRITVKNASQAGKAGPRLRIGLLDRPQRAAQMGEFVPLLISMGCK
jgi:hypothetical protein